MKVIKRTLVVIVIISSIAYNAFAVTSTIYGPGTDDVLVYGHLLMYLNNWCEPPLPPCPGWGHFGYGFCRYDQYWPNPGHRGTYRGYALWSSSADVWVLKGDALSTDTGGDLIYPSDEATLGNPSGIMCTSSIVVDITEGFPCYKSLTIYGDYEAASGSGAGDYIWGWDCDENIYGGPGADIIYGHDGNDYIEGNNGYDILYQESCTALNESEDATMKGGTGNDELNGGPCQDYLHGEDDGDCLYGNDGHDHLFGGSGDDWIIGGLGDDVISGWTGVDHMNGTSGDDSCWCYEDYGGKPLNCDHTDCTHYVDTYCHAY